MMCPISHLPLNGKVAATEAGSCYELEGIMKWFATHTKDPCTNIECGKKMLLVDSCVAPIIGARIRACPVLGWLMVLTGHVDCVPQMHTEEDLVAVCDQARAILLDLSVEDLTKQKMVLVEECVRVVLWLTKDSSHSAAPMVAAAAMRLLFGAASTT
jgi:hypothetical protein